MYTFHMRSTTLCFSGHRPGKIPWLINDESEKCIQLKKRIFETVHAAFSAGYTHFISGMAKGVDIIAAEAVIAYKKLQPQITLECALPYRDQSSLWEAKQKLRHQAVMEKADVVTVLSEHYTHNCMDARNKYMVDSSGGIAVVFDGAQKGGTYNTLKYAQKKGLTIYRIPIE